MCVWEQVLMQGQAKAGLLRVGVRLQVGSVGRTVVSSPVTDHLATVASMSLFNIGGPVSAPPQTL